jgi:hypothetical protein
MPRTAGMSRAVRVGLFFTYPVRAVRLTLLLIDSIVSLNSSLTMFTRALRTTLRRAAAQSTPTVRSRLGAVTKAPLFSVFQQERTYVREIRKPSIQEAREMARDHCEMNNNMLMELGALGDHDANQERLRREIMAVDDVEWDAAGDKLAEINIANKSGMGLATFPNKLGTAVALVTGVGSIPMVFQLDLALWFNEKYVTTDVPPPADLETWLETGAWTWTWMEPVLGTASFTLLGFQFARAQMLNMRMKPYSDYMLNRRADRLVAAFPEYDSKILREFALTDDLTTQDARA